MVKSKKIEKNKSNFYMEWSDGEKSNVNYLWLRDNCPTAHDKDSNHRMYNILEASKDLTAEESKVDKDGKLVVKWSEGNHTSYYDPEWLRKNCYTLNNNEKFISPSQLWDSSFQNNLRSIEIEHSDILTSE